MSQTGNDISDVLYTCSLKLLHWHSLDLDAFGTARLTRTRRNARTHVAPRHSPHAPHTEMASMMLWTRTPRRHCGGGDSRRSTERRIRQSHGHNIPRTRLQFRCGPLTQWRSEAEAEHAARERVMGWSPASKRSSRRRTLSGCQAREQSWLAKSSERSGKLRPRLASWSANVCATLRSGRDRPSVE